MRKNRTKGLQNNDLLCNSYLLLIVGTFNDSRVSRDFAFFVFERM